MLAQQQWPLSRGFLWFCAGLHPAWTREEVGVDKQVCSEHMWAQLMPAGHETGVFPGVLPRLRVALVFPTQALGHERLALRCNDNKSPNHLIPSGARDEDAHHFLVPAACPPPGTPPCPAGRASEHPAISRGRRPWRGPACELPVAVSVQATDQGRSMAWPADCRRLSMQMAGGR